MIGIFDSGVGGLSIYNELKKRFPDKSFLYLSDEGNFPYGKKKEAELEGICQNNIDYLVSNGANIIVVACNSATVTTINTLREKCNLPILGIEPAIKLASKNSNTGKILLIATERTVENHRGEELLLDDQELIKVHHGELVDMIENHFDLIDDEYLKKTFDDILDDEVDSVVLGCTHYHLILDSLEQIYPKIIFYAPVKEVSNHVENTVNISNIKLKEGDDLFITTGEKETFIIKLQKILGDKPKNVRKL